MGKKISDVPHMLRIWDRERNKDKPEEASAYLKEDRYWKCPVCGYSWSAQVAGRFMNAKCPCHETNLVIVKGINDPLTRVKGLKEILDKDNDFEALSTQMIDSFMPVNYYCRECGRKWTAYLRSQVKKDGQGGYVAKGCNHIRKSDAPFCTENESITKFWDPANTIDPASTRTSSTKKAHFFCKNCGYDWTTHIHLQAKAEAKCKCCELKMVTKKGHTDLFSLVPEAKKYYDFEENKGIDICSLSIRDNKVSINWKCPDCGRKWKSTLNSRISVQEGSYKFNKCIKCYSSRIVPVSSKPNLVEFWDFEKNASMDINRISAYSNESAHWKCKCGYEWTNQIQCMVGKKWACPVCHGVRNKTIKGVNDVLTVCPEIATIYDFEKNAKLGLDIYALSQGSQIDAFFKCKNCGNEWKSLVSHRIKKKKGKYVLVDCPECSNKSFRTTPYSVQYPKLAEMYMEDINPCPLDKIRGVKARRYTYYNWKCASCNETFTATLSSIISSYAHPSKGCPYCGHKIVKKSKSFGSIHPELLNEYSKDNELDIFEVLPGSTLNAKWECSVCGTKWDAAFFMRHRGIGKCPKCYRNGRNLNTESFAAVYPELALQWSPKNTRKTGDFFYDYTQWARWICSKCGGDYGAYTNEFVNGTAECPYCKGSRLLEGLNSLVDVNPDLAKMISPNDVHGAKKIKRSTVLHLWRCPDCGGDYKASTHDIENGYDCPYCNGRMLLKGYNSLMDVNPEIGKMISPLNTKTADEIIHSVNNTYLWRCPDCGGDYKATTVEMLNGHTCPYCNDRLPLKGFNTLQDKNPELARLVSPLNQKKAYEIIHSTATHHIWRCPDCGRDYNATVIDMENGYDCPYCNDRILLKGFNSFGDRYPELLSEIYELGNTVMGRSPFDILSKSITKLWWVCCKDEKHKYLMSPKNRLMFIKRHREPCLYCRGQRRKLNHFIDYYTQRKPK